MSQTPYLLPFFAGGGGATVPVEGSSQAILFSLLGSQVAQDGYTRTTFTLLPDRVSGGFLVNHEKTILGRLPRNLRDTYPQLDHIITRGGIPEVHATISLTQGSGKISGNLYFPAPVFVMPTNFPPKEKWAMLPEGTPRPVDISRGDAQRLVDLNIPSHWLATLSIVDDLVVSVIDSHVLGVLSPEDSADIRPLVEHYDMLGLVPVARVFCYDKDGERYVVLNAMAVQEMSDEELEPIVSPLAPIDPYQPATGEFPVISDAPMNHAWAVTVSGDQVVESLKTNPDKQLRPITSPAMFALNPDGTKVLEAGRKESTDNALPEVQKVPALESAAQRKQEPEPDFAPAAEVPTGKAEAPTAEAPVVEVPAAEVVEVTEVTEVVEAADVTKAPEPEPLPELPEPEPAAAAEPEDFPPLPYPHARLGEQFQEEPEDTPRPEPARPNPALPNSPRPEPEPDFAPMAGTFEGVEGFGDAPWPEVQKVPVATSAAPTPETTGTISPVIVPEEEAPEDQDYYDEDEDYYEDGEGIQWLPAIGVILGALAITVAALGYFEVTPDLTLDATPAFTLLGGGMLVVLGSLWFMFRPRD
ncbi:hypothetical protein [Corynebacterium lowii]|uniref:Uncharacterized protein n=1 Tax=Corynebacterium lowii TaxID=1544413 RepID=A0A0Q0ZB43_9CORY|nr:hypothetical protein [Corynebacterium lowii]KQB87191.1 hypothetical protein Clow_00244 [Corynebacterium lowii]MDP9852222.1 hypothetical protein [Corynebacterium lowii]